MTQAHSHFKVFTGELAKDNTIGKLGEEVEKWARDKNVAAKSIGVEYLESSKKLVLSVGYTDGEAGYPIKLTSISLGRVGTLDDAETRASLEKKMEAEAEKLKSVICHELYITDDNEFLMVFMAKG
jgi:hypothetical protein